MKADNDLYRQLRELPAAQLWNEEVPKFNQLGAKERNQQVALVRAVGVVFSTSRNPEMKAAVKAWMIGLLQDPSEKIRRYATAAIPKLGGDEASEQKLLDILQTTEVEREKKKVASALEKIGGAATLKVVAQSGEKLVNEQKLRASVARQENAGSVKMETVLPKQPGLKLHLRCRMGLENIVANEVREAEAQRGKFRVVEVRGCCVVIEPKEAFTLAELYKLRCFDTASFVLGLVRNPESVVALEGLAKLVAAPLTEKLMSVLTDGALRYRLSMLAEGNHDVAVEKVTTLAYQLNPKLLNDAREAPWSIDVLFNEISASVELRPKISPNPRLYYRTDVINAASHPPLAACLARLAGRMPHEIVWDPFCGSALELAEVALMGGVDQVIGTDIDPEALAIGQKNFAAAKIAGTKAAFYACDFRDVAKIPELDRGKVSLVISNPPLGRRVRVPNMHGLFADLFRLSSEVLRPGGRLVFVNPLRLESTDPTLRLETRFAVDLGGYECRVEVYRKR
ncbi:MAG: methyltransferase domain-containing protein [Verrucomicrobia bacterium]|nr:methyltransferase domain-containing protein [Verrucomicrobiota bacterium]